jgi:hypothetical protein
MCWYDAAGSNLLKKSCVQNPEIVDHFLGASLLSCDVEFLLKCRIYVYCWYYAGSFSDLLKKSFVCRMLKLF